MEEEIASKDPGLAVVGTWRKLAWICPYVSERELSIGIVNLIIEFGRNRRARIWSSHALLDSLSCWRVGNSLLRFDFPARGSMIYDKAHGNLEQRWPCDLLRCILGDIHSQKHPATYCNICQEFYMFDTEPVIYSIMWLGFERATPCLWHGRQ